MVRLTCGRDCGNSPRKRLLRDFNFAVARGDFSSAGKSLAEDALWLLYEPSGQKAIRGRKDILSEYRNNFAIAPEEFSIHTIITHGGSAAANGAIKAKGGKYYVFCDVYRFSGHSKSAMIKQMTSYIIEAREGD